MPVLNDRQDPIIAVATAPGRGAVGIVRISGPELTGFVQAFLGRTLQPRMATLLPFKNAHGEPIDHGLAIYFPAPHSYTGEDVLELQAHGGPVVLQMLLRRCAEVAQSVGAHGEQVLPTLRLARPGEFTERAFLNDKLDLAQAEAVSDLINATTEKAARSASLVVEGIFSLQINALQESLTKLRMLVEATLDFPEEEIDFLKRDDAQGQIKAIAGQLTHLLASAEQGALLREGLTVAIAGQPNAGKSSLLNMLAGSDVAIVTPIAGTTRDKVTQTISLDGVPVHIVDTAGLRESADEVERIGIERAWQEIARADVVIFLHDLTRKDDRLYQEAEQALHQRIGQMAGEQATLLEVFNKADLCDNLAAQPSDASTIVISAKTGQGVDTLRTQLLQAAGWQALPDGVFIARERHVQALRQTQLHVRKAQQWLALDAQALELVAEELRQAQQCLGSITGEITADDLLGVIFSQFCIGK